MIDFKQPFFYKGFKMVLDVLGSLIGGGGGNRTRVRKSSAVWSTCLAGSFVFNRLPSDWQDGLRRFPEDS